MENNEEKTFDEEVVEQTSQENAEQQEIKEPEKKHSSISFLLFWLVLTLIVSVGSSFVTAKLVLNGSKNKIIVYKDTNDQKETVVVNQPDFTSIVSKVENTVVEVYTEKASYSNFWGNYVTEGAGSGVVYSQDGYIITNNHVIDGATSVKVTLHNGEKYEAEVIASDNVTDIAVIKIDATGLQSVVLGDSDKLLPGQWCLAIGNPLGTLGGTVTSGIISALSREVTVENIPMTLLQIDAAISPGNSGGGLFNTSGELIGIVNAKSSGDSTEGIGFSIPVNNVKVIVEQLITEGYVTGRAQLGIQCVSIENVQQAWQYKVNTFGVYVADIIEESTKKAGLQVGDVIVGLDDTQIASFNDLQSALLKYSAGDEVKLSVVRDKNQIDLTITLVQKRK